MDVGNKQHEKKVVFNSPGLVNNLLLTCVKGKRSFLGNSNYRRTVINAAYQKIFWAC